MAEEVSVAPVPEGKSSVGPPQSDSSPSSSSSSSTSTTTPSPTISTTTTATTTTTTTTSIDTTVVAATNTAAVATAADGVDKNQDVENPKKEASERIKNINSRKLFLGQVPHAFTEDDLRPLLSPYGEIEVLSVLRDRLSSMHKGKRSCFLLISGFFVCLFHPPRRPPTTHIITKVALCARRFVSLIDLVMQSHA